MGVTDWVKCIKWSDSKEECDAVNRVINTCDIKDVVSMDFTKVSNRELRDVATLLVASDYNGNLSEAIGEVNIARLKEEIDTEFNNRLGEVGKLYNYAYSCTSKDDGWGGSIGVRILAYSKAKPYYAMESLNKAVYATKFIGNKLNIDAIIELWQTQHKYTRGNFGEHNTDKEYNNISNFIDLVLDNKFEEACNKYFK